MAPNFVGKYFCNVTGTIGPQVEDSKYVTFSLHTLVISSFLMHAHYTTLHNHDSHYNNPMKKILTKFNEHVIFYFVDITYVR